MARDYAKTRSSNGSANKKKKKKPPQNNRRPTAAAKRKKTQSRGLGVPAWVWLFCGLCLGLVIAAGVYVSRPAGQPGVQVTRMYQDSNAEQPAKTQTSAHKSTPGAKKSEEKKDNEPRYQFYKMLPNYQAVIPGHQEQEINVDQYQSDYIVQAGAFREYDRADSLKAKIALLGIESEIHEAQLTDGGTIYRVRTKLIKGTKALNHILYKLHNHGIKTLVLQHNT